MMNPSIEIGGNSSGSETTVGEGAPAKGFTKGALYIQQTAGVNVALWRGKGTGLEPELVADLTGTPADGSVTLVKIATAALASIESPWRTRIASGGQLTTAAATGTKYFLLQNQPNSSEPEGKSATAGIPWRIGWVASDEAVEGLVTKFKIKAKAFVGTAAKTTVHVGLYKVTIGAKLTLGEEVGSGFNLELGELANTGLAGESAEFTIPEDGDYAVGVTVSAIPTNNLSIQFRALVRNVAA